MSARQQQLQTPLDEHECYWPMPFMSTAEWKIRYISNALLWWAETGRIMFPRLAMMAKDYFSTQRMSTHSTMVGPLASRVRDAFDD
jgi:hypothetical protein